MIHVLHRFNFSPLHSIMTISFYPVTTLVTDGEVVGCMDPGGNGAILNVGEGRGPGPPRGEGNGQLSSDSGGN
jgi:hypothetical protein